VGRAAPPRRARLAEAGHGADRAVRALAGGHHPGLHPGLGLLDDVVLVPMAIRWLLRRLPPEIAAASTRRR
jgi:hypothetical protein